jgi:hypothetical protein
MVQHTRVIFYHLLLRHKVVVQTMTSQQQQHYCLVRVEEVDYQYVCYMSGVVQPPDVLNG